MSTYAYFQGKIVPVEKANVSIMTHAFNYGTGVFEGIRAFYDRSEKRLLVFRLKEHLLRMQASCRTLGIDLPLSADQFSSVILKLLKKNACEEDVYVRPIAYKSHQGVGIKHAQGDDLSIYLQPMKHPDFPSPLSVCVSSWRRLPKNIIPPGAKICGAYVNSYLASLEARGKRFDDAIFLTEKGEVSEGTGMNIFVVKGNKVSTPAESSGILKGITRDTVMVIAEKCLKMPIAERKITSSELYSANEIFLTGTGIGIVPVGKVDKKVIGAGKIGKVTEEVTRLYCEIIRGKDKRFSKWCTPVE